MVARPAGFEPTVFRVGVENVIHCTTAAGNPCIIAHGGPKRKKNIGETGAGKPPFIGARRQESTFLLWTGPEILGILYSIEKNIREEIAMNTLHLKYAVEVERAGSITQAADNLFMAQPNLSKAIRELEEGLGITIFERTPRGVVPTPKGVEFLTRAKEILGVVR